MVGSYSRLAFQTSGNTTCRVGNHLTEKRPVQVKRTPNIWQLPSADITLAFAMCGLIRYLGPGLFEKSVVVV